jgi:hypothetical protein
MSMNKVKKQGYEAFVISADFRKVLTTGETVSNVDALAEDVDGLDVTATFINAITVNHDDTKGFCQIQGGDEDLSPYKVTFRVVTSASNQWELDVFVEVEEI